MNPSLEKQAVQSGGTTKQKGILSRAFAIREFSLLIIIIGCAILLSFLTPHFLTVPNLTTTAIGLAADGIIAVGMTVALVLGGFDLSVGSVMALSGVIAGSLYLGGVNIWIAAGIALVVGMICGLINGYFIGRVGLNPFITTLGMMSIARGASYVLTKGSPLSLAGISKGFKFIGGGQIFGFPMMVLIYLLIVVIMDFVLRRSVVMRQVFYVGSNEKAAALSGINVSKVKTGVFFLTGTLAAISGILTLSRFTVATPNAGMSAEMRAIAACVIGGASLSGGEGTILGSVLGVILLALVNNALILLNVSVYWQDLITGMILISAVLVDFLSHRSRFLRD
ncbi:MAG TPA: ABC transporter permease [Hydrogenispora sp.]|jgi:ribose transport system permease protein|nr:ABC transporter permease [Hydrogenispora sp.]